MSDLDLLLKKYRQGTISDEEMNQLNRLTRRDEVVESACKRAATLRRRRHVVLSVSAMALLLGGVGAMLFFNADPVADSKPLFAAQPAVSADDSALSVTNDVADPASMHLQGQGLTPESMVQPLEVASAKPRQVKAEKAERVSRENVPALNVHEVAAPQVMCNVGCDADSVISDVWDFLNA